MNDGNSLKVLLPENELNAAPLGDVDGQSDVNEALVQRLMGHWRDSLSPAAFKSALLNTLLPSPLNLVFPLTGMSLSNNHHL